MYQSIEYCSVHNFIHRYPGAFQITTKLASEQVGCRISFGHDGNVKSQVHVARSTGTTVLVTNLFEALPVRRGEFVRTVKKHFQKMVKVLQSYAIVAVGVRIIVTNSGKVIRICYCTNASNN